MQKITPSLWFDDQAEEAAEFYTAIFPNSHIGHVSRHTAEGFEIHQKPEGSAMTVSFTLAGQNFMAINGGPQFPFTEAVSFEISCDSQEEVDYYWEKLSEGGDPAAQQCGWLKDKYGLSWQIVPTALAEMMQHTDGEKVARMVKAMLGMKKLNIAELQAAMEE